ncbi:hypothetical protein Tco_1032869 [Tanacetum coccineum]|uniref:Uncharacterized protein n=1 Tax=Tanacetum coccineum TaxID=301880 RepID=A0ABQ5GFI5_9ASTR
MADQEQMPPQQEQPFIAAKQVGFNLEDIILNTNNEEYLAEVWYSAIALENSKVSFSIPTSGILGEVWINTFMNAIGAHYLAHSHEYVAPPSIEEDIIIKLKKKQREKVVPYTRFLSLLIMHKMKEGYRDDEVTQYPTQVFSVNNWALKPNQPEEPPFTDHVLAICNANEPVAFKASKPSSIAERVPQGTNTGAQPRHKKQSTSLKQPSVSSKEAKKAYFIIHSESASGNDASRASTAEADPVISAPSDFIPQQQGKGASSIARQVEEEEAFNTIKLEDPAKLVTHVQPIFKDLDLLEDDPIIVVDDSDEEVDDEVHATEDVETEDTLVPKSSFPRSSQIHELTNQVLILQSQKNKLELKKNKVEAEVALLKAQASFPNVEQLNELLVKSLKIEFLNILSTHDFSSSLPTELKDLPSKLNDLTKEELPAKFLTLPSQVKMVQANLKTLNALPSLLSKVTNALNQFAQAITLRKTGSDSVPSARQAGTQPAKGDSGDETTHVPGSMVESSKKKELKKFNFVTESGEHVHLNKEHISAQKKIEEEDKAKAARREGEIRKEELIDFLGSEDPLDKLNDLANKKRKHDDDIHYYFKAMKRLKSSVQYEDHLPEIFFRLHQGLSFDDHARTFSSLLLAEIEKRNLNPLKHMGVIEQLRQ